MKRKPENPAYGELKNMLPAFLIINGIILVGFSLYGAFQGLTWRAFTGLFLGNALCIANFILAGASAASVVAKASAKQGRFSANLSYGARYLGLAAMIIAGLYFKLIDIIPTFLPLFIPKIYYTLTYVFMKYPDKNYSERK